VDDIWEDIRGGDEPDSRIEKQLCYFGKAEWELTELGAACFLCQSFLKKICFGQMSRPQNSCCRLSRTDAQPVWWYDVTLFLRLEIHGHP
jgi:hypothetical protein